MSQQPLTLLIHGGGMRSLVAAASLADRGRVAMVYLHDGRNADDFFHGCFQRQAERYGAVKRLDLVMPHAGVGAPEPGCGGTRSLRAVQALAAAVDMALDLKADRVIWPVQAGDDSEATSRAIEVVQIVDQLVRIEHEGLLRIETPLLDLTLRQLIEAGHQMGAPWDIARSCLSPTADPCGECAGCRLRHDAFSQAGIDDPLQLAPIHR